MQSKVAYEPGTIDFTGAHSLQQCSKELSKMGQVVAEAAHLLRVWDSG